VVHNTEAHVRILELLLLRCDWGGDAMPKFATAPVLPPRTHGRPHPQPPPLQDASSSSSAGGGSSSSADVELRSLNDSDW